MMESDNKNYTSNEKDIGDISPDLDNDSGASSSSDIANEFLESTEEQPDNKPPSKTENQSTITTVDAPRDEEIEEKDGDGDNDDLDAATATWMSKLRNIGMNSLRGISPSISRKPLNIVESFSLRKELFLKMITQKKPDSLVNNPTGESIQRSSSADSIIRLQKQQIPKSILKKSNSSLKIDQPPNSQAVLESSSISSSIESESTSVQSTNDVKVTAIADTEVSFRSSAPDLTRAISKSASTKSLKFSEDEVQIFPVDHKSVYNRKPDGDVTFKHLTPKLKMEIREELNSFKRHEMQVHASSELNTAFH